MKPKRTVLEYLRDILGEMKKAERFVAGLEFSQFAANEEKVYAVTRALEIIGEASKSVPKSVAKRYSSVPWREMAGMRDVLIHDYPAVNVTVVWRTVTEDISRLKPLVERVFAELSEEERGLDET
jgi:uncharacterized protein with HEPN domain